MQAGGLGHVPSQEEETLHAKSLLKKDLGFMVSKVSLK